MAQMTPQVSDVLEKALTLSTQDRGLLIDRLIESLDEGPAEEEAQQAWAEEIKRRVDEIRSGTVEMIPGEQVLRELAKKSPEPMANFARTQRRRRTPR
jgi:putative addiction module component (TIGR02574 family)